MISTSDPVCVVAELGRPVTRILSFVDNKTTDSAKYLLLCRQGEEKRATVPNLAFNANLAV